LDPFSPQKHYGLAKANELSGRCLEAEKEYLKVYALNSQAGFIYRDLLELAKNCFQDENKAKKYEQEKPQVNPASLDLVKF
jgi:hypothetical protein